MEIIKSAVGKRCWQTEAEKRKINNLKEKLNLQKRHMLTGQGYSKEAWAKKLI